MVHQQRIDSHSDRPQAAANQRPARTADTKGWGIWPFLLLIVVLGGSTAILLEHYGMTNVVPGFGQGGRPAWRLGLWQLKDVPDATEAPYIHELVAADIISGYADDEFRPDQPISRAEFAALVSAAFVDQPPNMSVTYTDVPADFWGRDAIATATQAGFFSGYGNNRFGPEQPMTRTDALVALVQGLDQEAATDAPLARYADAEQISAAARPMVATAVAAGWLDNQPGDRLEPNQPLTRADAAALIYQVREQQ